jgi:hypothetical protein
VSFIPIARERIPFEWERIMALIGEAIALNNDTPPEEVRDWLVSGRSEAFWIEMPPNCAGIGITTIVQAGSECVCFIEYVAGAIKGGPRKFTETARSVVRDIEKLARSAGCTELRAGGRNWIPILDGWERFDDEHPNRMRKRLDG